MRAFAALLVVAACHRHGDSMVRVGALDRRYTVFAPTDARGLPLVIVLHGANTTGADTEKFTKLDELAAREQFVAAYPDGIDGHWRDGRPKLDKPGVDDVAFVAALIDKLATDSGIDRARVYVTGISNGAIMSYRLACELADRIAAIAPVAGELAEADVATCHPAKPVSVLAINGTEDPLVPYAGGETRKNTGVVLSAERSTSVLAAADGCGALGAPVELPDRDPSDGTRSRVAGYTGCPPPIAVELVTVDGGGHTWPGASQYLPKLLIGKVSRDFDANEMIWRFFVEHGRR